MVYGSVTRYGPQSVAQRNRLNEISQLEIATHLRNELFLTINSSE